MSIGWVINHCPGDITVIDPGIATEISRFKAISINSNRQKNAMVNVYLSCRNGKAYRYNNSIWNSRIQCNSETNRNIYSSSHRWQNKIISTEGNKRIICQDNQGSTICIHMSNIGYSYSYRDIFTGFKEVITIRVKENRVTKL